MKIGETAVCQVKDNKRAIVTFTFDDALYKPAIFFAQELSKYGLKGTFAITTDFVLESGGNDVNGTWEQWKNLINTSKFDVANHSKSHKNLTEIDLADLEKEINGARETLISKFKGQKVLCMVNPFNATNDFVDSKISEHHYAARNGIEGYNTLNPSEKEWLRLNYKGVYHDTDQETMNAWIDKAIKDKLWLIEMIHGVDGIGWEAAPSHVFSEHFLYVASKMEVWNATFEEATLYVKECQHASINYKVEEQKIFVNLVTDLPSCFDYPLTLKTRIPNEMARVILDGKEISSSVKKEEDKIFVYYDIIPNHGNIFILI